MKMSCHNGCGGGEKEERNTDDNTRTDRRKKGRCPSGGELSSQNMDECWVGNGPNAEKEEAKKGGGVKKKKSKEAAVG